MSKYPIKQLVMARVAGLIAKRHFDGRYPLCVTMDEIMNGEHDFTRQQAEQALHELEADGLVELRLAINQMTVYSKAYEDNEKGRT